MFEAGLMASFKLRTMQLFSDMGKLPMMFVEGQDAAVVGQGEGRQRARRTFPAAVRDRNGGSS